MNIRHLENIKPPEMEAILRRGEPDFEKIAGRVSEIIEMVRKDGDDALIRLEKELDGCNLTQKSIKVSDKELEKASELVDPKLKESLDISIENVRKFHKKQLPTEMWMENFGNGIIAGEKASPIDSVGLYVPHGKGSFPSVMVMLGVPATIAGVKKITVATPPDKDGTVDPNVLYVCGRLGISNIVKLGGAQAVAALSLGTGTVDPVSKILGPGSPYVNVAKLQLAGKIDIGLLAGPSESVVISDSIQPAKNVALDLINEAEHGPDSTALLLCDSEQFATRVAKEVEKLLEKIPEPRKGYINKVLENKGGAIVFENIDDAIVFSNSFSPEHLVLDVENPMDYVRKISHAGEILLGPNTPISAGNYLAGPNAVLPTQGFAKTMSALGVRDFMHFSSILSLSPQGLLNYREHISRLAEHEGFPSHSMSAAERTIKEVPEIAEFGIKIIDFTDRSITVTRETKESAITVNINKGDRDNELKKNIETPLQFLNHMIETISWRSGFNIRVKISLEGQYKLMHVVAEDIGMTIGFAFSKMIERNYQNGVEGSGHSMGVIDEASALSSVSFEGRALYQFASEKPLGFEHVEDMLSKDLDNFLGGFAQGGKCTIHAKLLSGEDPHHVWEAIFRAFGEAIRESFEPNSYRTGTTPGVKGI